MDYYSILGVPKTASQDEIKRTYRKLAMKHHPDRGGDSQEFQKISEAYDVLSDPDKRAQYDNPPQHFQGFNQDFGFDLNDIFNQAFGFGQGNNPFQQRDTSYRTRVSISLQDAYYGNDKILQMRTPEGDKVVTVKIPVGANTGDKIKYNNIIGNRPLVVEFVVLPDLKFERRGNDLYANISVSVLDLVVGTKMRFTTINNKELDVSIPPGTQPNSYLRIANEGMPGPQGFGSQYLLIKSFVPANIDNYVIEAIKKHQSTAKGN